MNANHRNALAAVALLAVVQPASADVISDWNDRTVAFVVSHAMGPPPAERVIAMAHLAMFDAVNAIERKYQPHLVQLPAAPTASKGAAAAAAAATVLAGIDPKTELEIKAALAAYLANIPNGAAKTEGIKLGEAAAAENLGGTSERRGQRAGHLSATHCARRLCTDGVHCHTAMAAGKAVRPHEPLPVPARTADRAHEFRIGGKL